MAHTFFNAKRGTEIHPFEIVKENANGTVWVRNMWYDLDEATGEGSNIHTRANGRKMLLTPHEDGYWYSKSDRLYGIKVGYKFFSEDTPRAFKNPKAIRADRLYLSYMLAWANAVAR